jgi:O-glycosyl hydrolase
MKASLFTKFIVVLFFLNSCANAVQAQTLEVKADNYLQVFEGAGISAGLFLGHHYSMADAASRDLAVRYIAKDLNMRYIQDYIDRYPADDPAYFDRRAEYLLACKAYRPDIKVSQVGNKFPATLMIDTLIGGVVRKALNTNDTAIYTKVAHWYFELFKAFKIRNVTVDILNVVNEPDFDKVYYYGPSGETQKNVALIFEKAVTKFLIMIDNPSINTFGIVKPKIMGPSTISPTGCLSYIGYFKQNYPQVWNMIDIVAYHQYVNGVNVGELAQIKVEAGGRPVFQSEMHTNRGDNLGTLPISDELRGCLSLASLFGNALRTGANCWFYFQTNYPNTYTPAGLLSIPWMATNPVPYKQYYAFKQLSSAQPINSNVLEHAKANLPKVDIVCLRKQQNDTIYVQASNQEGVDRQITLSVSGTSGNYFIDKYRLRTTNLTLNDDSSAMQTFSTPVNQIMITISPYSVNTIILNIKNSTATSITAPVLLANEFKIIQTGTNIAIQSTTNTLINALQVMNSDGKIVYKRINIKQTHHTWQSPKLAKGIYMIQLFTSKGMAIKKHYYQ